MLEAELRVSSVMKWGELINSGVVLALIKSGNSKTKAVMSDSYQL